MAVPILLASLLGPACTPGRGTPSPSPSVVPSAPPTPKPLPDPLPDVVARVNGMDIPLQHARIIVNQAFSGKSPTAAQNAAAYRSAVEQLVVRELLRQEATRRHLAPDAAAVERLRKQIRGEYKTEAEFKAFLAFQGLDPQSFVDELRVKSLVEAVIKQETQTVPSALPEAEARAYYAANPNLFESNGRPIPFEDVRGRIETQVVTFKRQEALNALLTRLRKEAAIDVFI